MISQLQRCNRLTTEMADAPQTEGSSADLLMQEAWKSPRNGLPPLCGGFSPLETGGAPTSWLVSFYYSLRMYFLKWWPKLQVNTWIALLGTSTGDSEKRTGACMKSPPAETASRLAQVALFCPCSPHLDPKGKLAEITISMVNPESISSISAIPGCPARV